MSKQTKVKVGLIGCGNISGIYFRNCAIFRNIEIVAVADLIRERAEAAAAEHRIARALSVRKLLADPDIEIVLNLTIPKAHVKVAMAALKAGKSVYNEKPLAISLEDGRRMIRLARSRRLLVGCAPDTFMGAGIQTCRKLIDDGAIGRPVGATTFMTCHGHESWHPAPEFYYQNGGGPMFDMGPYYLTALVNLMGPVRKVSGMAQISFPKRTITSPGRKGESITVRTPTHIAGIMDFSAGATGTIVTSFDVWAAQLPHIEVYGTEGTLSVPDPNTFDGPVRLHQAGARKWRNVRLSHRYARNSRGLGVADMARALRSSRKHRASGELALHVLEIMHGFMTSSRIGKHVRIQSAPDRPKALPRGLRKGHID